jgi:hypothetical protein
VEVHVFPENMRGTGAGHYAWDLSPNSTMTNANVDAAVQSTDGREMKLSYKGGTTEVTIPEKTPIVTAEPAELSDLKPGAAVLVIATKQADGSLTSIGGWVAKNGVNPPM